MKENLKPDSGEEEILKKLSKVLYITRIGKHVMGYGGNTYPFCLIGATEMLKQYVRGKYEFLLIFSHFDNRDWQQVTLQAEKNIRHRKGISERRPLINFYILVSNAKNLKNEIDKMKGGTSTAIIPFTFDELLGCDTSQKLSDLILSRFGEYIFENNMLGEEQPIEEDTLLFGDRGKIADSIVQRCIEKKYSGIFGLRRSGKSSVLRAVERRLEQSEIKYIEISSRSELQNLGSWQLALYDIARKVKINVSGIEQKNGEPRAEYNKRLGLSSTEEDYEKRPTNCFLEDIKLYTKNEPNFVIAIDEVELITYNTANSDIWKDLNAYDGFWGALRDCELPLIICGVNSTINEQSKIYFNGQSCDNPMYQRIQNCSGYSKTYLPAFTDEQTGIMINTLGGFSNIGFSNISVDINRAFGGQPYAIRQFCSFVFEHVKEHRKNNEVYQVSKATFDRLIKEFTDSREGEGLFRTILDHIQIYPEEFDMLKNIAHDSIDHGMITSENLVLIDHLEKYGLIEYDSTTHYVTFNIASLQEYICKISDKKHEHMSNDERRQYVQDRVKECEAKLKRYLLNMFTYNRGVNARAILTNSKYKITVNRTATPAPDPQTCPIRDFFDHKKFVFYFSSLKTIINDNWGVFSSNFQNSGISKANFTTYMEDLNAGRTDADHYDPENAENCLNDWEISDSVLSSFEVAYDKLKEFFSSIP